MVKAPRSKGCRICVQRRVKCDQTRPFCQRCLRANRQCTGFDLKFIDEGPALRGIYGGSENEQSGDKPSSSSPSSTEQAQSQFHSHTPRNPSNGKERSVSPFHDHSPQNGAFERGALVSLLAPNVFQDQLLAKFIASTRDPVLGVTAVRCHALWLAEIASKPTYSDSLTWALRAISISHIARRVCDDMLLETSRRIYGKALLKLNHTLQDIEEALSSDTLSATVLLAFYEIFNCTDRNSWIKHAGGAGRLIQLRGPDRHKSGFDRLVFVACRTSLIMDAFEKKTPCFLARLAWRKVCWDIHHDLQLSGPLGNTYEEYFQDLVSHPGYLAKTSQAVDDPDAKLEVLQAIRAQGLAHRLEFSSINARMSTKMAGTGNKPVQIASSFNDKTFPMVYQYPDIHIASLYCVYWAVMCGINISIVALEARIAGLYKPDLATQRGDSAAWILKSNDGRDSPPTPKVERGILWNAARNMGDTHAYIVENARYAREICMSAEHVSNTAFLGPFFLVFALRLALRMFINKEEKAWIVRKLGDIGRDMGLASLEVKRYKDEREGRAETNGIEWVQESELHGKDKVAA